MLAINGDGLIVGANNNAKIMLNGLVDLKNENFNKIFTTSFSSIATDILNNKILKIADHLGSSVFMIKSQNFKESKFIETGKQNKTYACKSCEDTKIKREKCILIRSTFSETNNISAASRKLGGSKESFEKALPLLKIMGKNIFHAGNLGSGNGAKICNNMALGIAMIAASESLMLAKRLNIDIKKVHEIMKNASGNSWPISVYPPCLLYTSPSPRDRSLSRMPSSA